MSTAAVTTSQTSEETKKERILALPILHRVETISVRKMTDEEMMDEEDMGDGEGGKDKQAKRAKYEFSISSEYPVPRWFGVEILSHEKGAVDTTFLKSGLSILDEHYGPQVGIMDDGRVGDDRKIRGVVTFSEGMHGQEIERDVASRIRRYVSVGYRVLKAKLIETTKDGIDRWLVTKWMPVEASLVSVPADPTVGTDGRSLFEKDGRTLRKDVPTYPVEIETDPEPEGEDTSTRSGIPITGGERSMSIAAGTPPAQGTESAPAPAAAPASAGQAASAAASPAVAPVSAGRNLSQEAVEINRICRWWDKNGHPGLADRADDFISRGLTPAQVSLELQKEVESRNVQGQPPAEGVDVPARDRRRYRALRAVQGEYRRKMGMGNFDGLEAEMDQELRKNRSKEAADNGGILIPWRFKRTEEEEEQYFRSLELRRAFLENRALLGTTLPSGGASLVDQLNMPDIIDLLRNKALVLAAGASFMPGMNQTIKFKKKTGAPTFYWMGENPPAAVTKSAPSFGYVNMTPKTLQGTIEIPRQLMVMSASIDMEGNLRNDLTVGHGLAYDLGFLHGQGAASEPLGVFNTPGVGVVPIGGLPDHRKMIKFGTKLAKANVPTENVSFMTEPGLAGEMMAIPIVAGQAVMLWAGTHDRGVVTGYPARSTNQIKSNLGAGANESGIVLAYWPDYQVVTFGNEIEILLDPLTQAGSGQILFHSFSMADGACLRPESFVIGSGAVVPAE